MKSCTMPEQLEATKYNKGEFLCVATFLPLKRWRSIIPFLRMASKVQKQLRSTEGSVRDAVKADFFRKHFWTFSVWRDRAALNSFVRAEPHSIAVEKFKDWATEGAAFVEWSSTSDSIDWDEALRRLKNPNFYHKLKKLG